MDFKSSVGDYLAIAKKRKENDQIAKYGHILTPAEEFKLEKEEEQKKAIEAEQQKQIKIGRKVKEWLFSVPKRYKTATFDSFNVENQGQRNIINYMKTGRSLILGGDNGTGKTHLAFASCLYQIKKGKTAKYSLASDFFDKVRMSFKDGTTAQLIKTYGEYDYLILDEVDKTQGSRTEFVYLASLINSRYNEMLPTVLMTNAKQAEITKILGESVVDRVAGEGKLMEITAIESYRLKDEEVPF